MKWLIVNGDDFGMSVGISRGIVEAHRLGILTSTSFMVNRPASGQAAELARDYPRLSVGLHLELTDPARTCEEIEDQLECFHALVGAVPTHLDSHHDAHLADGVLPHVLSRAARIGVPVRGGSGVFINLEGTGGFNDTYLYELAPKESSAPIRHIYEETIYILKGQGATTVWIDEKKKQTIEWHERSYFAIPPNAWHQHHNLSGNEPIRYIAMTAAPRVTQAQTTDTERTATALTAASRTRCSWSWRRSTSRPCTRSCTRWSIASRTSTRTSISSTWPA